MSNQSSSLALLGYNSQYLHIHTSSPWTVWVENHPDNMYSLLMHHIKIKSPANFMQWTKRFVVWFISFQSVLFWWYYNDKKSLPDIGDTTIQDVGLLAAMEPGVHTMSHELILQFRAIFFLDFKWILMMRSDQNISHCTTAKLSVHVWNHNLIWWQNKIDTQKHFHKTTITSS